MKLRLYRRPSDRELISWLETGRPTRIDRWLDDALTVERLERLTEFAGIERDALDELVAPPSGFAARAEVGVRTRIGDLERAGVLLGLLRLGADTARAMPTRHAEELRDSGRGRRH